MVLLNYEKKNGEKSKLETALEENQKIKNIPGLYGDPCRSKAEEYSQKLREPR